jgi:hypothetical protein
MILHYTTGSAEDHKKVGDKLKALWEKEGVNYIIEIKRNRPVRSLNHNRYYRAVLKSISIHVGEDHQRLHELFKSMFNYSERHLKSGVAIRQPESTSNLDSKEFSLYIDRIKKFAKDEWDFVFLDEGAFDYYTEQSINEQYSNTFDRV